jgi:hypothetical protein
VFNGKYLPFSAQSGCRDAAVKQNISTRLTETNHAFSWHSVCGTYQRYRNASNAIVPE